MPKFLIRIRGRNIKIGIAERKWLFWTRLSIRDANFLTTRFVEAETANEAIESVKDIVNEELQIEGWATAETVLDLEKVQVDEEAFDTYAPGGGFTFY